MPHRPLQFRLRTLLVVTTLVAIGMAGYVRYRRLEGMARIHERELERLKEHKEFLSSVSFDVPREEWIKIGAQQQIHQVLADAYRLQFWRPWVPIDEPRGGL